MIMITITQKKHTPKRTKVQQAMIEQIDRISAVAMHVYRDMQPGAFDYTRGAFCGYQLSIAFIAMDIPDFASNALSGRPRLTLAETRNFPQKEAA
jgi:hypothetical protein